MLQHPRDMWSIKSAHAGYFWSGDKVRHRDLIGKLLMDWDKQMPHYGSVDCKSNGLTKMTSYILSYP